MMGFLLDMTYNVASIMAIALMACLWISNKLERRCKANLEMAMIFALIGVLLLECY